MKKELLEIINICLCPITQNENVHILYLQKRICKIKYKMTRSKKQKTKF